MTDVGRLVPSEWVGRPVEVVIDRPLGSRHPDGGFDYELNYGFVPGLIAPDGEELDAYVVGPTHPVDRFDGVVVAVVLREDDVEDKLIVSDRTDWTHDELIAAVRFQERFFRSTVVLA
jgi:inorganic pyrophosphatase